MSSRFRPWRGVPAYLALAWVCAGVSNHFAGPTRRLSWRSAPGSPSSGVAASESILPEPSPELLERFPALQDRPESDIDGEAARWLHSHGALFLDARRTYSYGQGHISGARGVSVWEDGLEAKVDRLAALAPDLRAPVVIYCSGGGMHRFPHPGPETMDGRFQEPAYLHRGIPRVGSDGLAHHEGRTVLRVPAILTRPWPLRLMAWALGAVLVAAALPKIGDPPAFAQALHGFGLLPEKALAPLALTLPWLELCVGLGLIAGVARRSAALLALGLMLTFFGALGWNLREGHAVECGCFGSSASKSTEERFRDMKMGLARNLILAMLASHLVLFSESRGAKRTDPETADSADFAD